jgi:hypothetical protein
LEGRFQVETGYPLPCDGDLARRHAGKGHVKMNMARRRGKGGAVALRYRRHASGLIKSTGVGESCRMLRATLPSINFFNPV